MKIDVTTNSDTRKVDKRTLPILLGLLVLGQFSAKCGTVLLDFEGLPDGTIVANQYSGLNFTNAIVLSSGISLNEFEFPPHSGSNVVSDNGGSVSIAFASAVTSFGGYFSYADPVTLVAFDSLNNQVAAAMSPFSNNEALSGDKGSTPNEFLQVSFGGGIFNVTIGGDPGGGSFVMDDATFQPLTVPEATPSYLIVFGGLILFSLHRLAL